MAEKLDANEKKKSFWRGAAFLGALVVGAEILF